MPRAICRRAKEQTVNPPLKELLAIRANDPRLPDGARELARGFLEGESASSELIEADQASQVNT